MAQGQAGDEGKKKKEEINNKKSSTAIIIREKQFVSIISIHLPKRFSAIQK